MSRSLLTALVAVLVATVPAAARAQSSPTLFFDQPCYAPGNPMVYGGSGYTPNGSVTMFLSSMRTQQVAAFDTVANPRGYMEGAARAPGPEGYIADDDWTATLGASANDNTRVGAGEGPATAVGFTTVKLSRFEVQVNQPNGRPPRAAKRMDVTAAGYTAQRGKALYVHYLRGSKKLKTVKVGRLNGDCGRLERTLPRGLPRGLPKGRYRLVFNSWRREPRASTSFTVKLRFR